MQDKRKVLSTILTSLGRDRLIAGKLSYKFFSISDEETNYKWLSSSFNNDPASIEESQSFGAILEPFFPSLSMSAYPNQLVPKIFDNYSNGSINIPTLTCSINGNACTLNISYSDYLQSKIQEAKNDCDVASAFVSMVNNNEITQNDLYRSDALEINYNVYDGVNRFDNEYSSYIEFYNNVGDRMDIIRIAENNELFGGLYSVGWLDKNNGYTEIFTLQLPDDMELESLKNLMSVNINLFNSAYGYKNPQQLVKRLINAPPSTGSNTPISSSVSSSTSSSTTSSVPPKKHKFAAPAKAK